jgi:acid phosphatase type 7
VRPLAILVVLGLLVAMPAQGAPRHPAPKKPRLALSRTAALPGELVRARGRGFRRRSLVRLKFAGQRLRTVRARRSGRFSARIEIPSRSPGRYWVVARSGKRVARLRFRTLARPTTAAPPAPAPEPVPPPEPPPVTLVAAGDIACRPELTETTTACRQARTAELVSDLAPDAVATLGDAQYENGELLNYQTVYDSTWGAFKAITRPATGNHEYQGDPERDSADGHFTYFGEAAGDPDEGYYSYQLGSWTLFVLNSGSIDYTRTGGGAALPDDCWPVSCAAGSGQETWLRTELEALPDDACVIAYWHHPLISSGFNGQPRDHPELKPVFQDLYDNGAELALTGHIHNYERFTPVDPEGVADPAGVRQFVVGTGGRNLFGNTSAQRATSEFLDFTKFGVLQLELTRQAYSFAFVAEDGTVADQGGGTCHGRPS